MSLVSQSFKEIGKRSRISPMCRKICLEKRLLSKCFPGKEKQMRNDTCFIYIFIFRNFLKGRFIRLHVNVNCQRLGNEFSYSGFISLTSKSVFAKLVLLCLIMYALIFFSSNICLHIHMCIYIHINAMYIYIYN